MNTKKLFRPFLLAAVLAALAGSILAGEKACDISAAPCLVGLVEKLKARGWLGIETDMLDGVPMVKRVVPASPAEKAGLAKGDLLREVNGVPYRKDNMAALDKIYQMMVPDQTLTYTIERQGKTLQVPVKLARIPEELMAQWIGQHVLEAYEMLNARKGSGGR